MKCTIKKAIFSVFTAICLFNTKAYARDGWCYNMIDTMVYNLVQTRETAAMEAPGSEIVAKLDRLVGFSHSFAYVSRAPDFMRTRPIFEEFSEDFYERLGEVIRHPWRVGEPIDWMMRSDKAMGYIFSCYRL